MGAGEESDLISARWRRKWWEAAFAAEVGADWLSVSSAVLVAAALVSARLQLLRALPNKSDDHSDDNSDPQTLDSTTTSPTHFPRPALSQVQIEPQTILALHRR